MIVASSGHRDVQIGLARDRPDVSQRQSRDTRRTRNRASRGSHAKARFVLDARGMGKLHGIALAIGLTLGACVTETDIDTSPQPTDGQDDGSDDPGDDRTPIDPSDGIVHEPQCTHLQDTSDPSCTPP